MIIIEDEIRPPKKKRGRARLCFSCNSVIDSFHHRVTKYHESKKPNTELICVDCLNKKIRKELL